MRWVWLLTVPYVCVSIENEEQKMKAWIDEDGGSMLIVSTEAVKVWALKNERTHFENYTDQNDCLDRAEALNEARQRRESRLYWRGKDQGGINAN